MGQTIGDAATGASTPLLHGLTSGRLQSAASPRSIGGVYTHQFDAKYRVVIPAIFRDFYAEGGYLFQMPRLGNYVALFPLARWEVFLGTLRTRVAAHLFDAEVFDLALDTSRAFLPDVQGRVSIPPDFRAFARLTDVVELRGRDTHLALLRGPVAEPTERALEALQDFAETELP